MYHPLSPLQQMSNLDKHNLVVTWGKQSGGSVKLNKREVFIGSTFAFMALAAAYKLVNKTIDKLDENIKNAKKIELNGNFVYEAKPDKEN